MNSTVIGTDTVVTLDSSEAFLMMGSRINQWPMVVRILEWPEGGTYLKVSGHRADRNGDPIAEQPTSECLMLGHDSRLADFPAWLADAVSRGTSPVRL
jgi:hypothetical protein